MADPSESIEDPGRHWREMVRVGAIMCTLAATMPWEGFRFTESVWGFIGVAIDDTPRVLLAPSIKIFYSLVLTVMLAGPVFLISASENYFASVIRRNAARILLIALWILSVFPPHYAGLRIFQKLQFQEVGIALSIMALSVFLLISALALLATRRVWRTPLFPFGMGVQPAALLFAAWTSAAVGYVQDVVEHGIGIVPFQFIFTIGIGLVGSVLILIGWLKWWNAVRAAMRAKPTSSVRVPEPTQS